MKRGLKDEARKARAVRRATLARERADVIEKSLEDSLTELAERGEIAKSYSVPDALIEEVDAKERARLLAETARRNESWAATQKSLDQTLAFKRNQTIRARARRNKTAVIGSGTLLLGGLALWWLTRK